jgi:hypothetical protein
MTIVYHQGLKCGRVHPDGRLIPETVKPAERPRRATRGGRAQGARPPQAAKSKLRGPLRPAPGRYCFFPKSVAFCPTRMIAILVIPSPFASVPTTFISATTVPSAAYFLSYDGALAVVT